MNELVENVDYTIVNSVLKINEGVEHIPYETFKSRGGFTEVILPSSLISIGKFAFAFNHLTKVVIPDSVRHIKRGAFYSCNIEELTLGKNVMYIGADAFSSNKISKIVNNSIELRLIDNEAFRNNKLTKFVVNSVPLFIGVGAFCPFNCKDIIKCYVGKNQVFYDYSIDREYYYSYMTEDSYTFENGVLKIKDGVTIIERINKYQEDCISVEMPDSVLIIERQALKYIE